MDGEARRVTSLPSYTPMGLVMDVTMRTTWSAITTDFVQCLLARLNRMGSVTVTLDGEDDNAAL